MLSREKRINIDLFNKILKLGKKKHFKYFYILILKDDNQKNSHVTFVAPKKQFKKAIDRNNIKRKCFGLIKDLYTTIPSSLNIIFFLKNEINELDLISLKKEIKDSLNNI
ncbi:MAG: ribonuclease P protein component [Candidatus Pacebacteria bacterium]|nr:ribonuclease P protein component [Candidatus Paceibacterota bacterium]